MIPFNTFIFSTLLPSSWDIPYISCCFLSCFFYLSHIFTCYKITWRDTITILGNLYAILCPVFLLSIYKVNSCSCTKPMSPKSIDFSIEELPTVFTLLQQISHFDSFHPLLITEHYRNSMEQCVTIKFTTGINSPFYFGITHCAKWFQFGRQRYSR